MNTNLPAFGEGIDEEVNMKNCPACGAVIPPGVKEFSGEGITIPNLSESVQELVDGVIESTGYGI